MLILFGKPRVHEEHWVQVEHRVQQVQDPSDIVWQYLYTMKLNKLKEQEDEPIPSDIPSDEETKINTYIDEINKTINKWKSRTSFDTEQIPEGKFSYGTIFNSAETPKIIEIGISFTPNMDPKPVIPRTLLAKCIEILHDGLIKINPNIVNYPTQILDEYEVTFYAVNIFPAEGIFNLSGYIPRPLYNTKVVAPIKLDWILNDIHSVMAHYTFNEGDLPTFSDDYSPAMYKVINRSKTIFMALRKGTWKGHKYDLGPFIPSNLVVHQETLEYSLESRVIHPHFYISYGSYGKETLDGEPLNHVLHAEIKNEFLEYIQSRFKQFEIKYN